MRYRIEYADGRYCNFANGRAELLKWLKLLKQEEISDIRKVYKGGVLSSLENPASNISPHKEEGRGGRDRENKLI